MFGKIKPYLIVILLVSSFLFLAVGKTGASDASISCSDSGCSGISGAIFNETNLVPGANISKTVSATNNYSQSRTFAAEIVGSTFSDSSPSLADELSVTVKDNSNSSILYGPKTLSQWKNDSFVNLASIDPGVSKEFLFEISFSDVGNDYQGLSLNFDLNFGFEEIAENSSSQSSSDNSSNSSSNQNSSTSGGQVLGASPDNVIGTVLGLSATNSGIVALIVFLVGVILVLFGAIIMAKSLRIYTSDN